MASSGNLCTWNPLNKKDSSITLTEANTIATLSGADPRCGGTVFGKISDSDGYRAIFFI